VAIAVDYLISLPSQLAPQLRSLRKARQLSQAALALKLGVSQSRIAAIERNPAAVSAGQLLELLRVLDVSLILRDARVQTDKAQAVTLTSPMDVKGEW
jgi:HTH-type transcriptional regulator/antitoxin HipB